jgi:hypothetical protein
MRLPLQDDAYRTTDRVLGIATVVKHVQSPTYLYHSGSNSDGFSAICCNRPFHSYPRPAQWQKPLSGLRSSRSAGNAQDQRATCLRYQLIFTQLLRCLDLALTILRFRHRLQRLAQGIVKFWRVCRRHLALPDVVVADGGGRWVVGGEGEEEGSRANKRPEAAPRTRHVTVLRACPCTMRFFHHGNEIFGTCTSPKMSLSSSGRKTSLVEL